MPLVTGGPTSNPSRTTAAASAIGARGGTLPDGSFSRVRKVKTYSQSVGVGVDASDLRVLGQNLRKARPDLYKKLQAELRAIGDDVAYDAQMRAAQHSNRIARTIKVRVRGMNLFVEAGGKDAPHAAAIEHKGVEGKFRHPVFGRWDVKRPGKNGRDPREQDAHPYLAPAARANSAQAIRRLEAAIDKTMRDAGFRN